ncbi:MAG: rhomboid family intramembrane serine protease [Candidatus Latescibacterota bacterium]
MIPIRDANPSGTWPVFTVLLVLANAVAFALQLSQGVYLESFIMQYGLVPARVTHPGDPVADVVVPAFTSLFLHGGWLHLLGNMWFLWIFGDNIEDRLGHLRFLVFYLLCGLGAGAAHVYFNPVARVPTIGASGAIAGVLGAYMLCFPRARILTLVPVFVFVQFVELPAFLVLFMWFALQFLQGTVAAATAASGGVAWWAHVGGFVVGMVLIALMRPSRRSRQRRYQTWLRQG